MPNLQTVTAFLLCAASLLAQNAPKHLATIEFFGYEGLDTAAIRQALPVHEGDLFPGKRSNREWRRSIEAVVFQAIGKRATDVRFVCCTRQGDFMLYIGLPGMTYHPVPFNPPPKGRKKLPKSLVQLYERAGQAGYQAILQGNSGEDRSQGYSLFEEPKARALQLAFRDEVRQNEGIVFDVLLNSSNPEQRAIAAEAVGYATRSAHQVDALVKASLDSDDEVRNNATRALGVLVTAFPDVGLELPLDPFVALMSSGSWADHNKASLVLERLTAARNPAQLERLRASPALPALIEMARWRNPGHAYFAITALGRIGLTEETVLNQPITPEILRLIISRATMPSK